MLLTSEINHASQLLSFHCAYFIQLYAQRSKTKDKTQLNFQGKSRIKIRTKGKHKVTRVLFSLFGLQFKRTFGFFHSFLLLCSFPFTFALTLHCKGTEAKGTEKKTTMKDIECFLDELFLGSQWSIVLGRITPFRNGVPGLCSFFVPFCFRYLQARNECVN